MVCTMFFVLRKLVCFFKIRLLSPALLFSFSLSPRFSAIVTVSLLKSFSRAPFRIIFLLFVFLFIFFSLCLCCACRFRVYSSAISFALADVYICAFCRFPFSLYTQRKRKREQQAQQREKKTFVVHFFPVFSRSLIFSDTQFFFIVCNRTIRRLTFCSRYCLNILMKLLCAVLRL